MEEKPRLHKIMETIFALDGKVYVGIASALTFLCLVLDSVWEKWKTPEWWTSAPLGVFCVILITFAGSKILTYWTDSKFNSPPGTPPIK